MNPKQEKWIVAKLEKYRTNFQDGRHLPSLMRAAVLCDSNDYPAPRWVLRGLLDTGKFSLGRKGRGNSHTSLRDMVDYWRWHTAEHWLRNKRLLPGYGHPARRAGAFAISAEWLKETPARGEARSVERSHGLVQRAIRNGTAARYFATKDDPIPEKSATRK